MILTILARIAALPTQRLAIFSLIIAGFYYFAIFDDGSTIDQRIDAAQKTVETEQGKLKESEAALKRVEQIRASITALNDQFKIASQQLPSEIQASEILRTIDTLARSAGVSIKSKEPLATKREDILEVLPLHVVVEGSFSEITMFLYYISIMERISRVLNFNMAPAANQNDNSKRIGMLQFEGEILSYRYAEGKTEGDIKK